MRPAVTLLMIHAIQCHHHAVALVPCRRDIGPDWPRGAGGPERRAGVTGRHRSDGLDGQPGPGGVGRPRRQQGPDWGHRYVWGGGAGRSRTGERATDPLPVLAIGLQLTP